MDKYEVKFKTTTLRWNERHTFSVASFRHLTRIIPIAEILSFPADQNMFYASTVSAKAIISSKYLYFSFNCCL